MPPEGHGLAGRRLFITGGTGFLGRSLLDHLSAAQARGDDIGEVDILTRSPAAFLERFPQYRDCAGLRFVKGSLADLVSIEGPYTDLIHAADDTHRQGSQVDWFRQIVTGAEQALALAERTGVQRFLLVSSGAVYGPQCDVAAAWGEDARSAPLTTDASSSYAQGKRAAEHLCALYAAERGFDCVIARCFALLSAHIPLDGPYAAGNFIRDALSDTSEAIYVQGDGSAVRTYLSGTDMADWMFALLRRGVAGQAYNVGAEQPITVRALAELIRDRLAPEKSVVTGRQATGSARNVYAPDIVKARGLGLDVRMSLPALIDDVGAALRARAGA